MGPVADLLRAHERVGHEHLGPDRGGNQPVAGEWDAFDIDGRLLLLFLPTQKVDRTRKGGQHEELREGKSGPSGKIRGGFEGVRLIRRQAEDERAQHVQPMLAERLQLLHQAFAGEIELFEDRLQTFGGHGLDADQRPLIFALRMASRYSGSSADSMVIWVKKTMFFGSFAISAMSANLSLRICSSSASLA